MNRTQIARLGGLTSNHNKSDSQRYLFAKSGGDAVVREYGRAHMARLAIKRWEAYRAAQADTKKAAGPKPAATSSPD